MGNTNVTGQVTWGGIGQPTKKKKPNMANAPSWATPEMIDEARKMFKGKGKMTDAELNKALKSIGKKAGK